MTTPTAALTVNRADARDRPVLEQLWTMFRHEMSAFTAALPDTHGRFRQERLDAGLERSDRAVHLFRLGSHPVGLAVLRGLDADEGVISSFFVAHGARRSGVGRQAVRRLTGQRPGRWSVAFQDANTVASAFWRSVAAEADDEWVLEHRAVPGRPELAPDAWASFTVRVSGPAADRTYPWGMLSRRDAAIRLDIPIEMAVHHGIPARLSEADLDAIDQDPPAWLAQSRANRTGAKKVWTRLECVVCGYAESARPKKWWPEWDYLMCDYHAPYQAPEPTAGLTRREVEGVGSRFVALVDERP